MHEYLVSCSKTAREGARMSFESWQCKIYADNEDEVREILAEAEPGAVIDKITLKEEPR